MITDTVGKWLRRLLTREDGNGTIEFVIVVPVIFLMFASSIEAGVYSVRQAMLDRALDMTVRDVRVGLIQDPTHDVLTSRICEYASVIHKCEKDIRLEMIKSDARAWAAPPDVIACRDRAEDDPAPITITGGENNELMILRVCVLFDPSMPGGGLGRKLHKASGDAYAITSQLAYVLEPYQ